MCLNKVLFFQQLIFLADDNLRIALIYLMNDVVQKSSQKDKNKKSNDMVKMAFHPHVVNAFGMAGWVLFLWIFIILVFRSYLFSSL